jgi:hypothetical protein
MTANMRFSSMKNKLDKRHDHRRERERQQKEEDDKRREKARDSRYQVALDSLAR